MSQYDAYADKPIDPVQYAYNAYMQGKEVPTVRMAGMVKSFLTYRELSIIAQMCEKFGHVAVASRLLTKRQRIRYGPNRIQAGRSVYYLFDSKFLPADIGAEIKIEEGVTVYQ